MTTDTVLRSAPKDGASMYCRLYDYWPLPVKPGPSKDWLAVPLVNGKSAYIKTSEVEVSQYIVNKSK